jgi:hypothetical protein
MSRQLTVIQECRQTNEFPLGHRIKPHAAAVKSEFQSDALPARPQNRSSRLHWLRRHRHRVMSPTPSSHSSSNAGRRVQRPLSSSNDWIPMRRAGAKKAARLKLLRQSRRAARTSTSSRPSIPGISGRMAASGKSRKAWTSLSQSTPSGRSYTAMPTARASWRGSRPAEGVCDCSSSGEPTRQRDGVATNSRQFGTRAKKRTCPTHSVRLV